MKLPGGNSKKNLPEAHIFHHKSHMDWLGIEAVLCG
jgi:hypothetical protein